MIRFYQLQIRSMPGQTPLTVFAPNWELAAESEDFRAWFQIHQPRSIEITQLQYWDRSISENREATPDEVSEYVRSGRYAQMRPIDSLVYFRH